MGIHVADYVFSLADGQEVAVPVRERFEIGFVPTDSFRGPSGLPYLAVTDGKHQLFPRNEGKWQEVGRRQTEYLQATARSYFLWSWTNPEPGVAVENIEIVPRGPAFVIAGVTLSHLDEHPFARQGRREAKITITEYRSGGSAPLESFGMWRWTGATQTTAFPLSRRADDGLLDGVSSRLEKRTTPKPGPDTPKGFRHVHRLRVSSTGLAESIGPVRRGVE